MQPTYLEYYKTLAESKTHRKGEELKLFSSFMLEPNETAYYLLGYLWSDGYIKMSKGKITGLSLEVVKEDGDYLLPLFQQMGEVLHTPRQRKNRKTQLIIFLKSSILGNILNDLGLCKNRVDCSQLLKLIPVRFQRYFMLGIFDGDGCFYIKNDKNVYQASISASSNTNWSPIINLLNRRCNIDFKISLSSICSGSMIRVASRNATYKLGEWMYYNHDLGLPRKKEKWLSIPKDNLPKSRLDRFSPDEISTIINMSKMGTPGTDIAKLFRVHPERINKLLRGERYTKKTVGLLAAEYPSSQIETL